MRLVVSALAPRVERVVNDHAVPEHVVIVREQSRQPQRDRQQAGGLRRKIEASGVGAANDRCEFAQGRIGQGIPLHERVKTALLADMTELDVGHIERNGTRFDGDFRNTIGGDEQELGFGI